MIPLSDALCGWTDARVEVLMTTSYNDHEFLSVSRCFSGHGQHLTGLGHVKDLARAMANVLGKECAKGQVYNVQVCGHS